MGKLTLPQRALLQVISGYPKGKPMRNAAAYAPMRRLMARQMVAKVQGWPDGWGRWTVTPAGSAALASPGPQAHIPADDAAGSIKGEKI